MSVFQDQEHFMKACGQTVDSFNKDQFDLYVNLINEELEELHEAISQNDKVEMLDALIDIMVVTIGAVHSMGSHGDGAWNAVHATNLAKIDAKTGMVRKREDGKVLKPVDWKAPNLLPYLNKD